MGGGGGLNPGAFRKMLHSSADQNTFELNRLVELQNVVRIRILFNAG